MSLRYVESGRLQRGLDGGVSAVAFSPDGTYIATAGMQDPKVYIWRVADNKLLHTYANSNSSFLSLEWLPGRTDTLLCGSKGGWISMLRFNSAISELGGFWAHDYPIERLAAMDVRLVSGAHPQVSVWKLQNQGWEEVTKLTGPHADSKNAEEEQIVMGIHWTKTKAHTSVVLITYMHHGIIIYNSCDWSRIQSIPLSDIGGCSVSPNGSLIALSVMGFGFDLYDLDTGDCIASFQDQSNSSRTIPVLLVHGGHALLGGSTTGKAVLWNVHNHLVHQTFSHDSFTMILAIAAHYDADLDQFLIATGASDENGHSIVSVWMARDAESQIKPRGRSWSSFLSYVFGAVAIVSAAAFYATSYSQ